MLSGSPVADDQVCAHADWCVALFEKNSRYNQTLWAGTINR